MWNKYKYRALNKINKIQTKMKQNNRKDKKKKIYSKSTLL